MLVQPNVTHRTQYTRRNVLSMSLPGRAGHNNPSVVEARRRG